MSLRDELMEEKRKQKEREQLKQKATKSGPSQEEVLAESYAKQFDKLKQDVENGNIPDEWQNRYNSLIEKIKKELSGSKEEFSIKEKVSQRYYENQTRIRRGKESAVTLFNDYITAQLKKEGFRNVAFALRDRVEMFATQSDYDTYRFEQSRYSSEMGFYQDEHANLDPDCWSTPKPTAPVLKYSGERHVYEIYAEGSLYQFKRKRKDDILSLSRFSKLLPIILGILCAVAAMVYFCIVGNFFGLSFPVIAMPYYAACGVGFAFAVRGLEWFSRKVHYGRLDDHLSAKERHKIIGLSFLLIFVMFVAIGGIAVVAALPFIL